MAKTFQAKLGDKITSVVFSLFSWLLLVITGIGLNHAESVFYLLILSGAIFPVLLVVVSTLRLAVIFSRKLSITKAGLEHRQVFKNHIIPASDIRDLHYLRGLDGHISSVRIVWSGPRLYIDRKALADYPEFIDLLLKWVPENRQQEVDSFELPEADEKA